MIRIKFNVTLDKLCEKCGLNKQTTGKTVFLNSVQKNAEDAKKSIIFPKYITVNSYDLTIMKQNKHLNELHRLKALLWHEMRN